MTITTIGFESTQELEAFVAAVRFTDPDIEVVDISDDYVVFEDDGDFEDRKLLYRNGSVFDPSDGPGEEDGPWAEGWAARCGSLHRNEDAGPPDHPDRGDV